MYTSSLHPSFTWSFSFDFLYVLSLKVCYNYVTGLVTNITTDNLRDGFAPVGQMEHVLFSSSPEVSNGAGSVFTIFNNESGNHYQQLQDGL